ncbi:hypothetical protein ANN_17225 [Periplaneta americana]|uniref:Uncharacterized protein n=1 Tax=Periplaneta americana TaxID=6978 RepID=A0ABQ8STN4_PERAM|nr:hypothetical protein ANN_17225 [Periplaneta americana]
MPCPSQTSGFNVPNYVSDEDIGIQTFLGGKHFDDDDDVKEAVQTWFSSQAASFCDEDIQKLVPRYDTCLNNDRNYVEK